MTDEEKVEGEATTEVVTPEVTTDEATHEEEVTA